MKRRSHLIEPLPSIPEETATTEVEQEESNDDLAPDFGLDLSEEAAERTNNQRQLVQSLIRDEVVKKPAPKRAMNIVTDLSK
jgi:hypothetical protein